MEHSAVKVFAKLPDWFRVPTPLGSYNPDWAVVIEEDGKDRVYFVVETKSSLFEEDRRDAENFKIQCGKASFRALCTRAAGLIWSRPTSTACSTESSRFAQG